MFSRADAGHAAGGPEPETEREQQLVRDRVDPDRDLGHSDRKPSE